VAFNSMLAALALTGAKAVVGFMTNSLGLLSEAVHSGLDLAAAFITWMAVRASGRPADSSHPYGHGKVEPLSALAETLLLGLTCVWIVQESIERLFFVDKRVTVNAWAFAVVALSIAVDVSRSRALRRAAEKYQSQALEADALHFSTDIWSSCVVLLGLAGVLAGKWTGLGALAKADALAALGVAAIVLKVCWTLARKAASDLLDSAPQDLCGRVSSAAAAVEGVVDVLRCRLRSSGPEHFADLTVAVGRGVPFEAAHAVADQVESAVRAVLPEADVVVHVEPAALGRENIAEGARIVAARHGLDAHGIRVFEEEGRRSLELHLEVGASLSLEQAHARVDAFEAELKGSLPGLAEIVSHIEPAEGDAPSPHASMAGQGDVQKSLLEFLRSQKLPARLHDLQVRRAAGRLHVSLHCAIDGSTGVREAHEFSEGIEAHLRRRFPGMGRVVVHVEPA
jgi:cation diffusion facilitator family transporter